MPSQAKCLKKVRNDSLTPVIQPCDIELREESCVRGIRVSLSLIIAALWAVAATVVALLPMRMQYVPGVALLVAAPLVIAFMGYENGLWVAVIGLLGFVSMFRNPLRYFWRKFRGQNPQVPR